MVLEDNAQFYAVNKFVCNFIESLKLDDFVLAAWKDKSNQTRLKTAVKKTTAKNPKRIVSKYLYFCQDERVAVLNENPGMKIRDVTCELGKRWQAFQAKPDPKRMARITELFETDKKRYDEAKIDLAPKKPKKIVKSPYLAFCSTERKINPKITMKELGLKWNEIKKDSIAFESYKNAIRL